MTQIGVEQVDVEDIELYENNPKDNEDSVELLVEGIPKFGFKVPVVLDEENTVVTGHARVEAVKELEGELDEIIDDHESHGYDDLVENLEAVNEGKVWALRAGELTEDEVAEFRIVDNRVQELSTWDSTKLQFELREIEEAVGFKDEEVNNIISASTGPTISSSDIASAEEELETHYEELSQAKQDRKSKLPCPHCNSWIHVDVEELERALKREGVLEDN